VGAVSLGGLAGASLGYAGAHAVQTGQETPTIEPFFGEHQSGIATATQTHGVFLGFALKAGVGRERFAAVMRLVTDDAARLTQGEPALPDNDPMLARDPARLTITVGFGRSLFTKLDLTHRLPRGFADIPAYAIDRLQPEFCGGDLVIQVGSDDALTLSHAARQITRTLLSFCDPVWVQRGFVGQAGKNPETGTTRNLFGQLDGTVNPGRFGIPFDEYVWARNAGWFTGGTMLVLRRIAMNLPTWDKLDETDKENVIGRRLESGAPLTGKREQDVADLAAADDVNLPIIDAGAHIRRAAPMHEKERFLRRPLNFDDGLLADGDPNAGLLFAAYAANIETQYIPVQNRVAQHDLLNKWTTTIGSATFIVPPGCQSGGFIGEGLLS
jgi:dye decolorizing peroxidase